MPTKCIIPGCLREKNCSIFTVPKTIARREKWLKAIRDVYSNLDVGKNFSVCEKHFKITDFTSYIADQSGKIVHEAVMQRKRLKHEAVPRLDLGQIGNDSMKQNKPRARQKKKFDYRCKDSDGDSDEMYQQNKFGVACDSLSTPTLQRSTNTSGDKNIIRTYLRQADYKRKEGQKKIGNIKELEKPLREENVFAAVNHLEVSSGVSAVVIKKEYDSEDTVSPQGLENGLLKLKEDYITEKYVDMIPNNNEVTSVVVKMEFDADDTAFNMGQVKLKQDLASAMIQDDGFVIKKEVEEYEVVIKQELDVDAVMMQPKNTPHP